MIVRLHRSQISNFRSKLGDYRFLFLNLAILLRTSAVFLEELVG
jgi:hypothetical protein